MHPYLVHIERKAIREWVMYTHLEEAARPRSARYYNANEAKIDGSIESGNPEDMETWYCSDENSANNLAESLAQKCPSCNINVYKLTGVARAPSAPPIFSKYTEKGLLPT